MMKEQEEMIIGTDVANMIDSELRFSSHQTYCVCVIDIVNSTRILTDTDSPLKVRKYILTFINSMAVIARTFGASIVKTLGDSMIFYFPETADSDNKAPFKRAFDCFSLMLDARPLLDAKLRQEGLPPLSYRISSDYGRVEVAKSMTSKENDLFGSTMSLCAKINSMASKNGLVIGGDLYRIVRHHNIDGSEYKFYEIGSYVTGLKFSYPVYKVTRVVKTP